MVERNEKRVTSCENLWGVLAVVSCSETGQLKALTPQRTETQSSPTLLFLSDLRDLCGKTARRVLDSAG